MAFDISRLLSVVTIAASLSISGCALLEIATDAERGPLVLQRAGEKQLISRSGRFVLQAMATANQPTDIGAQGQFEWIELRTGIDKARQLLLFLNPLGQSGPSLERELLLVHIDPATGAPVIEPKWQPDALKLLVHIDPAAGGLATEPKWQPDAVRLFDEQGKPLWRYEQRSLLAKLIGSQTMDLMSDADADALLALVMDFFQSTARNQDKNHMRVFTSDALRLNLRIAYDAAPLTSEITDAATR